MTLSIILIYAKDRKEVFNLSMALLEAGYSYTVSAENQEVHVNGYMIIVDTEHIEAAKEIAVEQNLIYDIL